MTSEQLKKMVRNIVTFEKDADADRCRIRICGRVMETHKDEAKARRLYHKLVEDIAGAIKDGHGNF